MLIRLDPFLPEQGACDHRPLKRVLFHAGLGVGVPGGGGSTAARAVSGGDKAQAGHCLRLALSQLVRVLGSVSKEAGAHTDHYEANQKFGYLVGCVHSHHCCEGSSPTEAIIPERGAVCLVLSGPQFAST